MYNLLKFFVPPDENEEWRQRFVKGGLKYVEAKKRLIAALDETFGAAREKRKELKSRPDFVRDVLREGAKKAGETATITLERVREAVGLGKLP